MQKIEHLINITLFYSIFAKKVAKTREMLIMLIVWGLTQRGGGE